MDLDHDEEGRIVTKYPAWEYSTLSDAQKIGRIGLVSSVQRRLLFSSWYVLYSR